MTKKHELRWADLKASGTPIPRFPTIWLTARVRTDLDAVRASLNRHWLFTEFEGKEGLPLYDIDSDTRVFTYGYRRTTEDDPCVQIFVWNEETLFVSWSSEPDDKTHWDELDFFYHQRLSLWYARGADVLAEFPMLRPDWDRYSSLLECRRGYRTTPSTDDRELIAF